MHSALPLTPLRRPARHQHNLQPLPCGFLGTHIPKNSACAALSSSPHRGGLQGTNPIYNLLPDMLSSLAAEPTLAAADFQAIMRTLLGYIGKDRHADALVDKLLARFEGVGQPPLWRNLAFCLSQASSRSADRRRLEA